MRAVRISASRAGKSPTALLGRQTAERDAILEDFVAFKHSSYRYLQAEKQVQTTYSINFPCKLLLLILPNFTSRVRMNNVKSPYDKMRID